MSTNLITGSEAILEVFRKEGVDTLFGYPGGAIMPFYDKIYSEGKDFKNILVRHEQSAAHAAQAYAQASEKVGVCMATSGPGATNLITGIANAYADSVPMVIISAQVVSNLIGTDAFQEIDMLGISMPITKWNCQVTDAKDIPSVLSKAFYIANTGRKGPVLIDITKDAQIGAVDFKYEKQKPFRGYIPEYKIDESEVDKAVKLIDNATRPVIFAGHGIILSQAASELCEFAEKTGIPVAQTLLGLSSFPTDHKQNIGMLGMHGNYGPNKLNDQYDLIIAVGMRFDDRVTGDVSRFAPNAKIIHIEIDESEIGKIIEPEVAILGDAKKVLKMFNERVKPNNFEDFIIYIKSFNKKEIEKVCEPECLPTEGPLRMAEVVTKISEKTNGEALVVNDVGQHQMISSRYYRFKKPNSLITSGGIGTMGFGLPAAMGAKLGAPDRDVVLFVGDGGFQMSIQELGTIMQYKINIKMVILCNNYLGMVRQWQEMFFDKRYSSTPIPNPDFCKVAEAYKIKSKCIKKREELVDAVEEMLAHDGPFLLGATCMPKDNIFPMIPPGKTASEIMLTIDG